AGGVDLGEVHTGQHSDAAGPGGTGRIADQVPGGALVQARVHGLGGEPAGVVGDDAAHAQQPCIGAVRLDRVERLLDVETRVDLAEVGLEGAEREVPPAPVRRLHGRALPVCG